MLKNVYDLRDIYAYIFIIYTYMQFKIALSSCVPVTSIPSESLAVNRSIARCGFDGYNRLPHALCINKNVI